MNSKNIKKLIIICLTFLVIFGIILFLVVKRESKTLNNEETIENIGEQYEVNKVEAQKVNDKYTKEPNEYNYLEIKATTQERIIKEYLELYKKEALNYISDAYQSLDEQYRKSKFNTLREYEQYVINNKEKLENMSLSKYQVKEYENYTEYTCLDQYNNCYIFNVKNPGEYTIFLDTYTVDLPQFTERYNNVSEQEKVVLNINKVIAALNAQDYKYIYSKLADSFKNNYYQNEELLKEFLVSNLYENNTVQFEEFAQEGTLYTYKIKVTKIISEDEADLYYGKNAPSQYLNIVMKLNEGTDFIMSFSIEE